MLALVAMIIFIIALFVPSLGPINLVVLGLAFVAAHLAFGSIIWSVDRARRTP
jgi:hypothetical protein